MSQLLKWLLHVQSDLRFDRDAADGLKEWVSRVSGWTSALTSTDFLFHPWTQSQRLDVWMACTGHGTWEFYTSRLFVRFKLCKTSFNYSHNYGSSWVWNGMKWHRLGMAGRDRWVTRQFWLLFQGEHLAPCGPSRSAKQHPLQLHLSELRCLYAHTARVC